MPTALRVLLLVALSGGGLTLVAAQTPAAPGASPDPLQEINRSLHEIVGLLQELRDARQVDQLMRRIALQRESLGPMERQLEELRSRREGAAEELRHLNAEMTFLTETAEEDPASAENYRIGRRQLEVQLELLTDKLARLDQQVLDAEADRRGRQAKIPDREEVLDDARGLR